MDQTLRDLWWVPVTRGITAIAFGILLLIWPAATIGVIAIIFASLFAVYAVTDIVVGIQSMSRNMSGILRVLLGFLEVGIVVYLFKNAGSGLTLAFMGLLMAVALVVWAIVLVGASLMSDSSVAYRIVIALAGFVTLFVGITVARAPAISMTTVIFVLGIFGLLVGPLEIAAGLMVKNHPLDELEN